jgi:hypothetical protein
VLITNMLAAIPAAAGRITPTSGDQSDVTQVAVAGDPVSVPPLTDADLTPIPVEPDTNGIADPQFIALDPGSGNTVKQIVGDEIKVPEEGGADYNVRP